MLKAKGMPAAFWGEAVSTAVFILNRAPTKALNGRMPFEAWHGRKPSVAFMRTFGCIGHVKNTKPGLTKLEDRSTKMVFLGYEEGSKAYRLCDPVTGRVTVSRDVVFDEAGAWRWDEEDLAEEEGALGFDGSFVVEQLVITSKAPAPAGVVEEAAAPGAGEARDEAPAAGEAEPPSPTTTVGTPPHAVSGQEQRTPTAAQVEYATPPQDVTKFVDAFHDGEEVRFRRVDNVLGDAATPGLAARLLGEEEELMMLSTEESATFAAAEREPEWRRAMLELMR